MTSEISSSDQTSSMGSGMTGSAGTSSAFNQNSKHSGISTSKNEYSESLNYNSNATNSNNETTNAGKELSDPSAETEEPLLTKDDSGENTEIVEQQEQPVKISPKHNPVTEAPKVKVTTNIVRENTTISVEVDKDATMEPKIPNTEGNSKEIFSSDISTKETKQGSDDDDSTPGVTNNANVVNKQPYSEGETNETIDENNDVNSVEIEKAKSIPESKSENNIPDLEVQGKDESNTKDKASVTNSNDESNRIDDKDIQNRKEDSQETSTEKKSDKSSDYDDEIDPTDILKTFESETEKRKEKS